MTGRLGVAILGCAVAAVGCASSAAPPKASLAVATAVPLQSLQNLTLVSVTVNRSDQASVFVVDTGATHTMLAPLLAKRLGLSVPPDALRREMRVVGGTKVTVPFLRVRSLQVGEALVEPMEIGVYDFAPQSPSIDGPLGGDFLNRFKVTFDHRARRMTLEPLPESGRR